VFAISMSTSFGPTLGSATSSSQMPGVACFLTSAFTSRPFSFDDPELFANEAERFQCAIELLACQRRRHLRPDASQSLGHHGEREADDIHAPLQQQLGHPTG